MPELSIATNAHCGTIPVFAQETYSLARTHKGSNCTLIYPYVLQGCQHL